MKLYSYQENALLAINSDPSHSQLISMPTGTGKTITFLAVAKEKNKKTLILVHRKELLQQTYEKAKKIGFIEEEITLITSENKMDPRKLNIAMVPTLIRNLDKYSPECIEMVIIDEAHHATANSYREILKHFKVFEEEKLLLGFTATPLRGDKQCLSEIFFSHSYKITLSEATQNGYICPVYGIKVEFDKNLDDIEMKQGDYNISKLDKVMNCEEINQLVATKCENLQKYPGIIFCTSVDHAKKIALLLRKQGQHAISISYQTPHKVIDKIYKRLEEGKIHFITNAVKLSEGFDYPPIQSVILARPTRSPVLYKQMIGRGLRNYKNKKECVVLEFAGNDDKMIRWEDIDENATFQYLTATQTKTREEALSKYKNIFSAPNVHVLNVRTSPFNFYECYICRQVKYGKDYLYYPGHNGFHIFKLSPDFLNRKMSPSLYDCYMWTVFWKEKYKSFYIWSEGMGPTGVSLKNILPWIDNCARDMREGPKFNTKRWYPSEEDAMTHEQKSFMKNPIKMSARKAEMYIEDAAIKQALKKYWMTNSLEVVTQESSNHSKVYELNGIY